MPQYLFRGRIICHVRTTIQAETEADAWRVMRERRLPSLQYTDTTHVVDEWVMLYPSEESHLTDVTLVREF
jgi:hypothetical protein